MNPSNPVNPTIKPGNHPPYFPSDNVPKSDDKGVQDSLSALKNFVRYRKQIWKNGKLVVDTDDSSNNKPIINNTNIPASSDRGGHGDYGNNNTPASGHLNNYGNNNNSSSGSRKVWKNGVLVVDEDISRGGRNIDSFGSNFVNFDSSFGNSFGSNFDSNFGSNFGNFGNFGNFSGINFGASAFDPPRSSTNFKRQVWKNGVLVVDEDTSRDSDIASSDLSNNYSADFYRNLNNSTNNAFNDRFDRMGNFGQRRIGFEGTDSGLSRGIGFDNLNDFGGVNSFDSRFDTLDRRNRNFFMDIRSNRVEDNCNVM